MDQTQPAAPDNYEMTADAAQATFEQLVQKGIDSGPAIPMTQDDWDYIRQEARSRAASGRPSGLPIP